jgi:hypothetical protein
MNKRNTLIATGIGVWVSGMLVGANAVDLLRVEPSGVLLAIGLILSLGNLAVLYRTVRQPSSQ